MNKYNRLLRSLKLLMLAAVISGCTGGRESSRPSTAAVIPETESNLAAVTAAGSADAEVISLPRRYDARKDGRISPVKDQGSLGTCWAFASLLALESSLRPDEEWDFSEDHMSACPGFQLSQEEGGEFTMSMAYLLSWQGPVSEADDPYGDGISPEGLPAVKHVQEIQILPSGNRRSIKEAVFSRGGVQTSLYTTLKNKSSSSDYYNPLSSAYYYPEVREPNHDVVIIGWDDDFSGDLFSEKAPGNGAFLCQNSWGTEFGEDGCFYVSYWDANIAKNNILYSLVEDVNNYDSIYQSDLCGWIGQLGYGGSTAWAVNIYQTAGPEQLKAVGFYATNSGTQYEVSVIRQVPANPQAADFAARIKAAEGTLEYAGYYTIPLKDSIGLEPGERFGVMIRLVTPDVIHPIAIEYNADEKKGSVDLSDGEGYISPDGEQWQHVESEQECNICLKAYTGNG